jgi:release factor glutamine methyltransferase
MTRSRDSGTIIPSLKGPGPKALTLGEALNKGAALLNAAGIETPVLDAALLLSDILNLDRTGLVLAGPDPLSNSAWGRFERALERRRAGECVAYILGRKEFRSLEFAVTPDVLVPRPDTETLVETALSQIDALPFPPPITLLDLCTGSGALAISLKHERPALSVWASDISGKALAIARENAARLLTEPITFIESDLFDRIGGELRFDLMVSNPPYVPSAVIGALAREVRGEPRIALDGGEDGLGIIRRIIEGAPKRLRPGGTLLMEADPSQMDAIAGILASRGFVGIQRYRDLSQQPRVIGGRTGE